MPKVNLAAFKAAQKYYPRAEMPFLASQLDAVATRKMYQGMKIIQNIPLTVEAVLKVQPLVVGGADVTVSCISLLSPNQVAIDILRAANIKVQIEHKFKEEYDFCLDCCGELKNILVPKHGTVELTQTGSELYKKSGCNYPIVSVDDSKLKILETFFGTGDGFIRSLVAATKQEIYNKKIVVFGYGKVGKGIVHGLIRFTDDIVIIESDNSTRKIAEKKGVKVLRASDIDEIKREIKQAHCCVTATGIKNIISEYYKLHPKDFGKAFLANMGAEDEFGKNFTINEILFNKKPLNFSISEPTTMKYLDPVLYAHNIGIDLIINNFVKAGYNPFPKELAVTILKSWAQIHKESGFDMEEYLA